MSQNIRFAHSKEDTERVMELAQEFGHSMDYMSDYNTVHRCVKNNQIMVHTPVDVDKVSMSHKLINGFYHIAPMQYEQDYDFVLKNKVIPPFILDLAKFRDDGYHKVGIIMQGGCHRDVFKDLINQAKILYQELWCWCSIKSSKPDGYKDLGFSFNPKIEYTFLNPNTDPMRESTYQLGRWSIS